MIDSLGATFNVGNPPHAEDPKLSPLLNQGITKTLKIFKKRTEFTRTRARLTRFDTVKDNAVLHVTRPKKLLRMLWNAKGRPN